MNSPDQVDQYESKRDFLDEVEQFLSGKADDLAKVRSNVGLLPDSADKDELEWEPKLFNVESIVVFRRIGYTLL